MRCRVPAFVRIAIVAATLVMAASGSPHSDAAAWWNEATQAYGESRALSASRTRVRFEEVDEGGAVQSYESGETVTEWIGAESKLSVVWAEKNGEDATEEWRKRYSKSRRGSSDPGDGGPRGGPPPGFDATPFDPKYAKDVSLGEPRSKDGMVEVPYSIKTSGGLVEGVAYFLSTGKAVSASQRWTEPPMFVSSMKSTLRYSYQDRALVIGGMRIEGQASILVVKKRFRMSFEFDDWKPVPR